MRCPVCGADTNNPSSKCHLDKSWYEAQLGIKEEAVSDTKPPYSELPEDVRKIIDLNTKPLHAEIESLKRELEAAKQDAMVYRREWELACERYDYAKENIKELDDALNSAQSDGQKDYDGMREFQVKFIKADQELQAVKSRLVLARGQADASDDHFRGCVRTNSELRKELESVKADYKESQAELVKVCAQLSKMAPDRGPTAQNTDFNPRSGTTKDGVEVYWLDKIMAQDKDEMFVLLSDFNSIEQELANANYQILHYHRLATSGVYVESEKYSGLHKELHELRARLAHRHIIGKVYDVTSESINALAGELDEVKEQLKECQSRVK